MTSQVLQQDGVDVRNGQQLPLDQGVGTADDALVVAQQLVALLADFKRGAQSFAARETPAQRMLAPLLRIDACVDHLLSLVFSLGLKAGDVEPEVLEQFWLARSEVAGARTAFKRQLEKKS